MLLFSVLICVFIYCLKFSTYRTKVKSLYLYNALIENVNKTETTIQFPTSQFTEESLRNNTRNCPYYGLSHGLFHPTVVHPRFIITGGAGFIGSHLIKRLRLEGYQASQIKVLDNLWRGRLHNLQFDNATWSISIARDFCLVDLRISDDALKFVAGADVVFHLADVVAGVDYVFSHQSSVFRNNILINTNTLYAARKNKIRNFIYVGTACSFPKSLQEGPGIHVLRENQTYPAEPESSYGWSKLMGEYEIELGKTSEFNVGILRLHNVYGPFSDYSVTTGQVIPSLIRKVLKSKNESIIVWGSGEQYRDFIYVTDVVDGLLLMLKGGMNRGVIQVGSGKATTIQELVTLIARLAETKWQKKLKVTYDISKPEGDKGRIANLDRAKTILKWQPNMNLEEGISESMSWMRNNIQKQRVLVIIIGQARGGNLAWKSLHKFLIQPFNAHLALYISNQNTTTFLHKTAHYIWTIPELTDWGLVFEMVSKECSTKTHATDWRNYCQIPGIFMGGVSNCSHPGSAGILLGFRWLVHKKILELNLLDKYDWFILTRADELYLCKHFNFFQMVKTHALLPTGEYYGGFSDRHIIGKSSLFMTMINITTELVCNSEYWLKTLKRSGESFNLEKIQKVLWFHRNISVSEFSRSMFTVRTKTDPTRWSKGEAHPDVAKFGLKLKYTNEFSSTVKYCKITNVTEALKNIAEDNFNEYSIY